MENNLRGKVQKALNATPCPKPSLTPRQVMIQQMKLEHNKPRWASELYTEILPGFQLNQLKIVTEANAKKKKKRKTVICNFWALSGAAEVRSLLNSSRCSAFVVPQHKEALAEDCPCTGWRCGQYYITTAKVFLFLITDNQCASPGLTVNLKAGSWRNISSRMDLTVQDRSSHQQYADIAPLDLVRP